MTVQIEKLLAALEDDSYQTRCDALRDCCPCRTGNLRDFEVWRAVFDKALHGNLRERDRAAHAIGTLTEKAVGEPGVARPSAHLQDRTGYAAAGPARRAAPARADEEARPRPPGRGGAGLSAAAQGARSGDPGRTRGLDQRAAATRGPVPRHREPSGRATAGALDGAPRWGSTGKAHERGRTSDAGGALPAAVVRGTIARGSGRHSRAGQLAVAVPTRLNPPIARSTDRGARVSRIICLRPQRSPNPSRRANAGGLRA